ncbi:Uncharacterized protein HZ326_12193 [Fusarium oxysporum f. sp. albedinis]|nr:Uncharacterized protein HZ326_12193 [Fusarium oxysporum f. sp. albedinis]
MRAGISYQILSRRSCQKWSRKGSWSLICARAVFMSFYLLFQLGRLQASGVHCFTSHGPASAAELSIHLLHLVALTRALQNLILSTVSAHTTCAATFLLPSPSTGPIHARATLPEKNYSRQTDTRAQELQK